MLIAKDGIKIDDFSTIDDKIILDPSLDKNIEFL
jgi:hypothetical protein